MKWTVVFVASYITIFSTHSPCLGQRNPPLPSFPNLNTQSSQNTSGVGLSPQILQQQQQTKSEELANVKDEHIKQVLVELSTLQTPQQTSETMSKVAQLVGRLFYADFDDRIQQIVAQGASAFPPRLLSAVSDVQGEEVKALVLTNRLEMLHPGDFAFLPLAIHYGLTEDALRNISGTKLASMVKANPGDTVIAYKVATSLFDRPEQQMEFLQSLGTKLLPDVQRIIMKQLLEWWGDPHEWKDRELSLLTSCGSPLLSFCPQSELERLDDELADRFVTILGQTQDIARGWWKKPMSLKKSWFELAKGARYFGAVHEWSFRRMQKLSFLLEGASPEDLELIPPIPEIKGLVIGNHYTELQARVVFDAFYHSAPLSQEDLQEFQFHVLDLTPAQLQRFDFADSFGTLDEMLSIMERQNPPSYPTVLQISYFMWPIVNASNSAMTIAPPPVWQKRELSQIGKLFFLLPKSALAQLPPDLINWDSNILGAIRSNHLTTYQIWRITAQILQTVDERFRPDYMFMIPSPFQKGIPTQNITQALLATPNVRPEVLRALIEETQGMLISQKSVILQRIVRRLSETNIIRLLVTASNPSELLNFLSPKLLNKNMATIIKTITEMPETGKFGVTALQAKLLPKKMLALWLKWVRENAQLTRWSAEDLFGRSPTGATNDLNYAILGLTCRDIDLIDPYDAIPLIMHYRHELYNLRRIKSSLEFNLNLRNCILPKILEYLKEKRVLLMGPKDEEILAGITEGEIEAVGGEILSMIPTNVMDALKTDVRQNIIEEIGRMQMLEMFGLVPLEKLRKFGTALFRDIDVTVTQGPDAARRRRRATDSKSFSKASNSTNASGDTVDPSTDSDDSSDKEEDVDSRSIKSDSPDQKQAKPDPKSITKVKEQGVIELESLNRLGNMMCYADNLFEIDWRRKLLKEVLEGKTSIGEKTCCLIKILRDRWFNALQQVYGTDTSTWNEFDLTAIGDLLIVLPETDLQKISTDSLGKAVTPILRQSAYSLKVAIPGQVKPIQFVSACVDALGQEGAEYMSAYKRLMKRLFQASQWMVNSVKTTQELIRDGVGRTGRIPRWAEHTLVKRQINMQGISGMGTTTMYTPQSTNQNFPQTVTFYPQSFGTGNMQQQMGVIQQAQPQVISFTPSYTPQMMQMGMGTQSIYQTAYSPQTIYVPGNGQQMMMISGIDTTGSQQATNQYLQTYFNQAGNQQGVNIDASQQIGTGATTATGTSGGFAQANSGNSFAQAATGVAQGAGFAQGNAQGGTFSQGGGTGTFAQSNTNTFSQGTGTANNANTFSQGTDPSQSGTNTFTARGLSNNGNQQPSQSTTANSGQGNNMPSGQQVPANASPQPNAANQQPNPVATAPVPQQTQPQPQSGVQPSQGAQQPPSNVPSQQSGANQPPNPLSPGPINQQPGSQASQPPPNNQPNSPQPVQQTQPNTGSVAPVAILQQAQPGPQPNQAIPGFFGPVSGRAGDPNQPGNERERSLEATLQDDTHNSEITCHGIRAAGDAAIGLTLNDLGKLSPQDMFDCVEPLGAIEWDEDTKGGILTLLKQKQIITKDNLNAITLLEMGNLVTGFSSKNKSTDNPGSGNSTANSDISMIDFTLPASLDIASILGQKITDPDLLKSLADKFNQDNRLFPGMFDGIAIARPENLRVLVMSLGNIICGLSDKVVNSIFETDASLFIDTSQVLGQVEGCNDDQLSTLATHAIRPSNFGPPRLWSQEDVETVGVVFAGLKPDGISNIPEESMQGLTPLAVKNLPIVGLRSLTTAQIAKMSFSAAMALSPSQLNSLAPAQTDIIKLILQVQPDTFEEAFPEIKLDEAKRNLASEPGNDTEIHGRAGGKMETETNTTAPTDGPDNTEDTSTTTTTTTEPTTTPSPAILGEAPPSTSDTTKLLPNLIQINCLVITVISVIRIVSI